MQNLQDECQSLRALRQMSVNLARVSRVTGRCEIKHISTVHVSRSIDLGRFSCFDSIHRVTKWKTGTKRCRVIPRPGPSELRQFFAAYRSTPLRSQLERFRCYSTLVERGCNVRLIERLWIFDTIYPQIAWWITANFGSSK